VKSGGHRAAVLEIFRDSHVVVQIRWQIDFDDFLSRQVTHGSIVNEVNNSIPGFEYAFDAVAVHLSQPSGKMLNFTS
jgi:hypothetical protein